MKRISSSTALKVELTQDILNPKMLFTLVRCLLILDLDGLYLRDINDHLREM